MESIIAGIESFIQSWCNKHGVTRSSFFEWKQAVISEIDRNSHLSTELTTENGY